MLSKPPCESSVYCGLLVAGKWVSSGFYYPAPLSQLHKASIETFLPVMEGSATALSVATRLYWRIRRKLAGTASKSERNGLMSRPPRRV